MDESYSPQYEPDVPTQRDQVEGREGRASLFNWWSLLSLMIALIVVLVAYFYISSERQWNRNLASENERLSSSLEHLQSQLRSMSDRLSDLQARVPPPAPTTTEAPGHPRPARTASAVHNDSRLAKLQNQVSEQQKQIEGAREDIERTKSDLSQTRDDLQSNISSTKTELNGSIARTHDELVVLQKRGERNYYEFSIDKSKQFSRVGPMGLSLHKADVKHKRFDIGMRVDDNELTKNGVNLYETVWISLSDRPQPVELVVNKIDKNHIEGYVSEPKYKKSELQPTASGNSGSKPLTPQPH
jgi:predicted nuclease with TOPRIM domain